MFIPTAFRVADEATLFDFIDAYGFATLISVREGGPFASHVPLLLDRERRCLLGHLSRSNPHWEAFDATETLAIFHGPHAYISPTWYTTSPAVPTWNYAAVHVYGVPQLTDDATTRAIVDATVTKYESHRPTPWANDLPDEFRVRLLRGIVGFTVPLTRIEGKYKLGQNRSPADQASMAEHLQAGHAEEQALAAFIACHSAREKSSHP